MFMCVCWISISDITDITNTQHTDGVRTDEETQNNYKEKHNVQNDHNETQNKREDTKKIDVQKKTTKDQKKLQRYKPQRDRRRLQRQINNKDTKLLHRYAQWPQRTTETQKLYTYKKTTKKKVK